MRWAGGGWLRVGASDSGGDAEKMARSRDNPCYGKAGDRTHRDCLSESKDLEGSHVAFDVFSSRKLMRRLVRHFQPTTVRIMHLAIPIGDSPRDAHSVQFLPRQKDGHDASRSETAWRLQRVSSTF